MKRHRGGGEPVSRAPNLAANSLGVAGVDTGLGPERLAGPPNPMRVRRIRPPAVHWNRQTRRVARLPGTGTASQLSCVTTSDRAGWTVG
jgi:hypothetical protein